MFYLCIDAICTEKIEATTVENISCIRDGLSTHLEVYSFKVQTTTYLLFVFRFERIIQKDIANLIPEIV